MKRTAVVSPYSLGALEAYRGVIKDISRLLGDPAVDVAKLFFAVMIQSGFQRFSVSDEPHSDIVRTSLLTDRVCSVNYSRIQSPLNDIGSAIVRGAKNASPSNADLRLVHNLASFVQDLYIAAAFKKPVATVTDRPAVADIHRLFRDDMAIVLESLLKAVRAIDLEAPVMRFDVPDSSLGAFKAVMASDVFEPYVDSHTLFESVSRAPEGIARRIRARARSLVLAFPNLMDLKGTTVQGIESIPSVLDATLGKAFGTAAKPFAGALSRALGQERRLLIYSFYPTWRRLWDAKLDKVRVLLAEERARERS